MVASVLGSGAAGWFTGRRGGRSEVLDIADNTIGILSARSDALDEKVKDLKDKLSDKDTQLSELNGRINVLSDLVTQRAEVGAVKEVVDRIAAKLEC